ELQVEATASIAAGGLSWFHAITIIVAVTAIGAPFAEPFYIIWLGQDETRRQNALDYSNQPDIPPWAKIEATLKRNRAIFYAWPLLDELIQDKTKPVRPRPGTSLDQV